MKFTKFILSALSNQDSVSSKRIFGGLGFLTGSVILIYDTISNKHVPDAFEAYFITCASLLGLDSITGIWRKRRPTKTKNTDSTTDTISNK